MRCAMLVSAGILCCLTSNLSAGAGDEIWEVLYDGVKISLKDAHFTAGTRRLLWMALDDKTPSPKSKNAGPEHLEFREEKSTSFKDGITTLVPIASLDRLEYDHDKKLVRVTLKQSDGKELTLIGSTKFVGINKFNLEGTAGKTSLGVAGTLQFQDGVMKAPVRGFLHHGAKPVDAPMGRPAVVVAQDKEKTEHEVRGLQPLYRVGAGQKLASVLMFQKVGQLDMAKLSTLRQLPAADKKQTVSHDYDVTLLDGDKQKLTLIEKTQLSDNQPAVLIGLVGRAAAGWKLFPPHTIAEVRFVSK